MKKKKNIKKLLLIVKISINKNIEEINNIFMDL